MKNSLFKNLLFLGAFLVFGFTNAQSVSGTVSDASGPLPGANVIVKGTTNGTTTDFDGNYTLNGVDSSSVLVFSYLGFITKETSVGSQSTINATLTEDATELGEVILTGYTAQNTRDITGSVSVVSSETLVALAPTSIEASLQGVVPGVTVGNQGGPGGASAVRIRGYGTINNNDPLYIIDGAPSQSGLTNLNPADVSSMQVLKDAAAASIYGNRAANGVIIVSTKGGAYNGEMRVTVDVNTGIDFVTKGQFPDLVNPQQMAEIVFARQANDGLAPGDEGWGHSQYGTGATPVIPDYITPSGTTGTVDLSTYDAQSNRIQRANKNGTDWFDEYFGPAVVQNYNLGIQGGSETARYYIGTGALLQEGIILETDFKRFSLRANSEFKITDKIRFGENVSIAFTKTREVGGNQDVEGGTAALYRMQSIIPVYDEAGNFGGTQSPGLGNGGNPVADQIRDKDDVTQEIYIFGNMYAEADLFDGLTFKTNVGVDYQTGNGVDFNFVNRNDSEPVSSNSFNEASYVFGGVTWSNTLNYSKSFGDHKINVLGGIEFQKQTFRQHGGGRTQYLIESTDYRYLDRGEQSITNFGNGDKRSYFSQFGKIDYSYNSKYLASFTLRRDESSIFTKENRAGVFPAASVGWRISDETFMEGADWLNDFKIKAGYGELGNAEIPTGRTAGTFGSDLSFSNYSITGANSSVAAGYNQLTSGNPDLQWETSKTVNVGFDAQILDNKWNIAFDWYKKTTEDVLLQVAGQDPTFNGNFSPKYANVGDMENKGFDLEFGYDGNLTEDIGFSAAINISHYKNEVLSLGENDSDFIQGNSARDQRPTRTQAGQPISSFYGYTMDGIFQSQSEVDNHATQDGKAIGRFRVKDLNNDGVIDDDDRSYIGSPHPDFTYGINLGFDYKAFDLRVLLQGSQGNDVYNFSKWFTDFIAFEGAKSLDYYNSWTPTNTGASLPQLTNSAPSLEDSESTYFVEDGSYLRIKNIVLGYNFSDSLNEKIGLDSFRIFLQLKNIATFTKYSGLDPEINLQNYTGDTANQDIGVDRGAYPQAKTIMLGLKIGL